MRTTRVKPHSRSLNLKQVQQELKALERRLPTIPPPNLSRNKLPVQVSIIVPSTFDADKPLKTKQYAKRLKEVKKWMDDTIGGETTIRSMGSYTDKKGKLIEERTAIVESSMTRKTYIEHRKEISKFIKDKRKEWTQRQVALKVEGQTFFTPYEKKIPSDKKMPPEIVVT